WSSARPRRTGWACSPARAAARGQGRSTHRTWVKGTDPPTRAQTSGGRVHLLDVAPELVRDDLAAQLEARGQLAVLDGEVPAEDVELLDLLVPVQAGIELVDVGLNHL